LFAQVFLPQGMLFFPQGKWHLEAQDSASRRSRYNVRKYEQAAAAKAVAALIFQVFPERSERRELVLCTRSVLTGLCGIPGTEDFKLFLGTA